MSSDVFPDSFIDYVLKAEEEKKMKNICEVCDKKIKVIAFQGTGICSENCRKIRDNEPTLVRAQVDAGDPLTRTHNGTRPV